VSAGATSEQVWAFWDVLPTLAELVGARPPAAIDGISMLPSIIREQAAGHAQQNHDYLYWEFPERGFAQAVRLGNLKGVRPQAGAAIELYDLANDLSEQHDVAAAHADIVARMEAIMREAHTPDEASEN
jgi:arylsulfatase A-like enzyme